MIIFLDACAIIYRVEGVDPWDQRLQQELKRLIAAGGTRLAVSELSWMECRVKPLRDHNQATLKLFQQFFTAENLHIQPLDLAVIDHATRLRAAYQLKVADALQAACALACGPDVRFITNDQRFSKVPDLITVPLQ